MKQIQYEKVDTAGQITAVVSRVNANIKKSAIARDILSLDATIEQVVFVMPQLIADYMPRLDMMGDELSINGSLAGAYVALQRADAQSGSFEISGLRDPVRAEISNSCISITFPDTIVRRIESAKNTVVLAGISYYVVEATLPVQQLTPAQRETIPKLLEENPAAGIVFYQANQIQPVVFVEETNSLVWEQACGSGSLAFSLLTGISTVKQPSGSYITITTSGDTLGVSVPVRKVD